MNLIVSFFRFETSYEKALNGCGTYDIDIKLLPEFFTCELSSEKTFQHGKTKKNMYVCGCPTVPKHFLSQESAKHFRRPF